MTAPDLTSPDPAVLDLTAAEVGELRAATPGCSAASAYLMHAGASLMPSVVLDAVTNHLQLEAAVGGYEAHAREQARLDAVYDSVGRLVGADRDEIALAENATVAWQLVFYSLPFAAGDRILTGEAEYAANYVAFLHVARTRGVSIEVVPSDDTGQLDVAALEATIDDRVKLISLTWMPTNGGLVNPAEAVGRVAEKHGVFFLLDACQAVGQWQVDVRHLRCDALTATGRKFLRGPRGTGFLYLRRDRISELHPPVIDHFSAPWTAAERYTLREDARRFETWENAYALRAGLGAAADLALAIGMERIQRRATTLADRLRTGLRTLPHVTVLDLGEQHSAIVSFTTGEDATELAAEARRADVVIGTSPPSSTRVDATRRDLSVINRASPHYVTTGAEVDRLLDFLSQRSPSRRTSTQG